ncbi:MAG: DUF4342 domain-containing protein [Bacillota bacterium]|nr:DUF4342 domain-containing protein [Bacillota bacterium]
MNLTLEKIDEIIERTNCSYKEAKEVLLETDGDVLEAVILLESSGKMKEKAKDKIGGVTEELYEKLRNILQKGDVNRITIEKSEKVIMDIPVTAGVVGAVFFAPAVITSIVVALATGHSVKIIKESGEIIDFKEYSDKTVYTVKEKASEMKEKFHKADKKKSTVDEEEDEDVVVEEDEDTVE